MYNCSPSFNWKQKLDSTTIAKFQRELGAMGYKYQFITLAGYHSLNHSMFSLAHDYRNRGMSAYSELQEREFADEKIGYSATKHQREVGTGYFDMVNQVISSGKTSTLALEGSTESEQFGNSPKKKAGGKTTKKKTTKRNSPKKSGSRGGNGRAISMKGKSSKGRPGKRSGTKGSKKGVRASL